MPRPNAKDRRTQAKLAAALGSVGFALPGTILDAASAARSRAVAARRTRPSFTARTGDRLAVAARQRFH